MRRIFLSAGVVALLAGPALAELADVRQALDEGKLEAGVNELKALARGGDPEAQLLLGQLHMSGKGVLKNQTLALHWIKKAVAQENAEAQYLAGTMYFEGKGAPISLIESERLFELAAEQGYPEAQYRLGLLYRSGHGPVDRDTLKAKEWLGKAAEQGDVDAQLILDEMETDKGHAEGLSGLVQDRKSVAEEPKTETGRVRKVIVGILDNMNGSLDGARFDYRSPMIIKEKDDGDISVILPGAKFAMPEGGILLLGSLRLTVKSQEVADNPAYLFDVALPRRFRAVDTAGKIVQTISFRQNRFQMVWVPELDAFVKADVSLSNIKNQGKGDLFELSMGRLVFSIDLKEDDNGRWSGDAFSVLATDIAAHMGSSVKVASLKSLAINAPFKGFDMQVYNRYVKRMTVDPIEVFAELQTEPGATAFVDSMGSEQTLEFLLSGLQIQDREGNPVFSLGSFGFDSRVRLAEGANSSWLIALNLKDVVDGKEGNLAEFFPNKANLETTVGNIPMVEFWQVMATSFSEAFNAAGQEGIEQRFVERIRKPLFDAHLSLNLDGAFDLPQAMMKINGVLSADPKSVTLVSGGFDVEVEGFDKLVEFVGKNPLMADFQPIIQELSRIGSLKNDGEKGVVATYRIEMARDGNILVNGESITQQALIEPGVPG